MTNKQKNAALFGLTAFLMAWQGAKFAIDFQSIMGAVTCAVLAFKNPQKDKTGE